MLTPETRAYVRLLIGDQAGTILTDEDLDKFGIISEHPKLIAADALLTIATNEVLLSKKITTQDLSTDGPAVAKALMDLAARLRSEAKADDAQTGVAESSGWAPFGGGQHVEGEEYRRYTW